MSSYEVVLGTDGGLRIDLDALLGRLEAEVGCTLDTVERSDVETHCREVLRDSMAYGLARFGLGRRVGNGRYLAVGDLGLLGIAVLLGPLLHLLPAGVALGSAKKLIRFDADWRPQVVGIYAQLGGLEREIFEAVHALQNEWIVTNYDAYETKNYAEAFGRVAPTIGAVRDAIDPARPFDATSATIANLVARRILAMDGSRYWIRF